jgi:hypothetical protein
MPKSFDVHGGICDLSFVGSRSMPVRKQRPDTVISLDKDAAAVVSTALVNHKHVNTSEMSTLFTKL